jgi:heme-degrading monooxygenase HmoA
VLVTMRVHGDPEAFRRYVTANPDTLREVADDARSQGCLHHRFGIADGAIVVVDEWESAEQFQAFFQGNERIPEIMREGGAQGEPEFTIADAIETADQF